MMTHARNPVAVCVAIAGFAVVVGCGPKAVATPEKGAGNRLEHLTKREREDAIRHAAVWNQTDVKSMDLRAGPQGKGAYAPEATVPCDYVQEKPSGSSAKFICRVDSDDEVKVKYGQNNAEVYAEVASSRLLWALGFGADRWYPVKVECHLCPADPHRDQTPGTGTVTFEYAAIERKAPGKVMESKPDQGWAFEELDLISDPSQQAERDALRLMAVFLQHTDSKPQQQRLVCIGGGEPAPSEGGPCAKPFMMMHDIGLTLGRANLMNANQASGANYQRWASVPIWKDPGRCVGKLSGSFTGTLSDPIISEAGRKFLADLMVQLSDAQITDMFEVARFSDRSETPVSSWVDTFKKKRDEISSVTCPH